MEYLIFVIGLIVGSLIMYCLTHPKIMGTLRLYESDEPGEQPYLFVELGRPVDELSRHKYVHFKVSLK